MKKLIAIATMLVFVFSVSSVYACGEKNNAAKASKASSNSSCTYKAAKMERADTDNDKAELTTTNFRAETADAKAHCAKKGDLSKASVMKADAKAGKADCPATKDCPVPCNKETKVENMKAENSDVPAEDAQASISAVSSSSE